MGAEVITLGCRLNIAESEAMRALAYAAEDLVIVNSCAVTAEAVKQTRKAIRRARRDRPDARIVVTGCAVETEPQTFRAMTEVDAIVPNGKKLDFARHAELGSASTVSQQRTAQVQGGGAAQIPAFTEHARAFVEVQNGCDHACTFCIIPLGRGESRSVPAGPVIDRIKALVDHGHREVVLTGVDVTSYGGDLPGRPDLGRLVERILKYVPDLPRLRLSSLDSIEIDDRLFDLVTGETRVMPHLHLSLQAGDDMILKRMKRRHLRADAIRIVERLKARRPEIAIGADIIAGFPTETEAMFANSLALVKECEIVHGHIFPYSPRAGTPAERMPQVDPTVVRERAGRLRAACAERKREWLKGSVGSIQKVLIERCGTKGHAENFATVRLSPSPFREEGLGGVILPLRVTATDGETLIGVPA